MHKYAQGSQFLLLLPNLTQLNQSKRDSTRRWAPPGLTYLTHHASCECRGKHERKTTLCAQTTLRRIINHPKRFMHCVPCMLSLSCFLQKEEREWRTAQRKTSLSVLSNPTLALRQREHEQALSFLTCEGRTRVNWGTWKAPQRVNASIRHMHREHSANTNPTCALRAPFASHTFHSCFDLCRARERSTRTHNEHSVENPKGLTKQPTRTQCMRVK